MVQSSSSSELNPFNNVCCIPGSSPERVDAAVDGTDNRDHGACSYVSMMHHPSRHHRANTPGLCWEVQSGPHGRHAMASRQIPAGTIIVQCLPLAHSILLSPGANLLDEDSVEEDEARRRRCVRCFFQEGDEDVSGLRKGKFGRCSKCRVVYYCSRTCQADDWSEQHKLECQYYVKRRKQSSHNQLYANTPEEDAIPLLLRTFQSLKFMRERPGTNSQVDETAQNDDAGTHNDDMIVSCGPKHFSSLVVSPEHLSASSSESTAFTSASMSLAKTLMESFSIRGASTAQNGQDATETKTDATLRIWGYGNYPDDSDNSTKYTVDQVIQRTLNAFQKNNFGIVNNLYSPIGEGVYPCAALLNHSCNPNCILRYKLGVQCGDGQQKYHQPILQIVSCRDIDVGEELCHSYVDLALCTEERQSRLLNTHGFVCQCKRCKKGECTIDLPQDMEDWSLWPLENGLTHGENRDGQAVIVFRAVDLDDALTRCQGLSETEQARIQQQSRMLHQNANTCMVNGDSTGELHYIHEAIQLYTSTNSDGGLFFSPFHGQLYSLRCSYLSALLANGQIKQALEQCEHIVSFLAVAYSHVHNHPLLGLQLYTLGDLYAAVASLEGTGDVSSLARKAKQAYAWAKRIMMITHGPSDPMVKTLEDNLSD